VQDLSRTRKIAAVAIGVTVLIPTAAQAATRSVSAGPPQKVRGLPPGADSNAFFRKTITVHVGDKVKWKFNGFHTVTIPAKGKKPPAFIGLDPAGGKTAGVNDAAGNPFWFNGLPKLTLQPDGALPAGGKSYNGKKLVSSGAPLGAGAPKPYTVKFTKKGVYSYYCTIHPGQKGKVKVVGKAKAIPSNKANAKAAKKEYAKVVKQLKKDGKFAGPPGNAVYAGKDTISSTILAFFPTTKSVPVGTTVTFSMSPKTTEAHTISFGPADYLQATADGFIGPDPANPAGLPVVSSLAAYPSDPPPTLVADGSNHGNGYVNTGVIDGDAASPQATSSQVTFSKAGTYNYICLIHPDMKGSIVVG
jgi:plastocyanin